MPTTSDVIRSHVDTILLAQLRHKDGYGYKINRDILDKTGKQFEMKEATLYSAFRRLEKAGYITSYWGDEELGARRRYYSITDEGRKAYDTYRKEWDEAKDMMDTLIESEEEA